MSLSLNSLLSEYIINWVPSKRYFWQKEKETDGLRYPIPVEPQYLDLFKLVLGLHIIEIDQLSRNIGELVIETAFPDNFNSIVERMQSLFTHLTNSRIKLKVVPCSFRVARQKLLEGSSYRRAVLFSGGLDSLCGAIKLSEQYPAILTHCRTNQVIFHKVLELSRVPLLSWSPLFCIDAMTKSKTGGISNTRGLLFLSSAYAIAASLGIESIVFCENGSQMLDVMLGSLVYPNKPATKNTNPIFVDRIEELFSLFNNKEIRIERPFQQYTKAEILQGFKNQINFEKTFSCFSTRGRSTMCGICYNCFVRRMALLAIDVKESPSTYEKNPFETINREEQTASYEERLRILLHFLRYYAKVLKKDSSALEELEVNARDYFEDPTDLAIRSAKEIFLGVARSLERIEQGKLNPLGKKAKELLNQIDKQLLTERYNELIRERPQ